MSKRYFFAAVIVFLNVTLCFSAQAIQVNAPGEFDSANALYKQAKYDDALRIYRSILDSGKISGALFYNIGNCYFKKGELGKALLNYERSRILLPSDSDVRSNYEFTRMQLSLQEEPANMLIRYFIRLFDELSANFLFVLIMLLYVSLFGIWTISLYMPLVRRWIVFSSLTVLVLSLLVGVGLAKKIAFIKRGAVVVTKEVEARFEPAEAATAYFKLTEGSRLEIIDTQDTWVKVKRFDGRIGWIPQAAMEKVYWQADKR